EGQQRGGEIAGEGRKADAAALRRDVANRAGGLQAMIIGVTPPFALVIEDAARIETEIAADRTHVAVGGPGDMRGGLRDHGIMLVDCWVRGDLAQGHRGAELERFFVGMNRVQFRHAIHVDQNRWRDDAAADVDDEIGAAAERHGLRIVGTRRNRLGKRLWINNAKFRQGVHQAPPFFFGDFSAARRRFSIASKTRSGVTGRSLKRMPIASAMALVRAGRKAASEPSPASLAPNGPCGSLLSTIPTSIGGESWMVGTR